MGMMHGADFLRRRLLGALSSFRQGLLPRDAREPDQIVAAFARDCGGLIDDEEHREVTQYLTHGEPELAFEGLMISLMRADALPDGFDFQLWQRVATAFDTAHLATLDEHVWSNFEAWVRTKSS